MCEMNPWSGTSIEDLLSPLNAVSEQEFRRLKHHCKRLKTFSTTPEFLFRDQGSEVQILSPRPIIFRDLNSLR